MPELSEVHERYAGQNVKVFAVGTGGEERLESVRQEKGLSAPLPRATDPWRTALGVEGFPETFFIDANGRIAERLQGGQDAAYFAARIDALLAEEGAAAPASQAAPIPTAEAAPQGGHSRVARTVYRFQRLFKGR